MTLKITFTDDEVAELFYWKERHPHPRVRKKMSVLYLKSGVTGSDAWSNIR
ncbi:hypothetical protein HMY34_04800 [Thiothrix subterranea]|uniref:hypothetical protein n=1 Tax=Thiothrix subterranea TaxID=2735563 RepID=UPI00192B01EF|nr:hypothetical protein [Thiothrix subterranea]QQZ28130.1 hypothetical protein HMY34_04800 [Thiothrix subterranea]